MKERSGSGSGEAPAKECPECHSIVAAGYAACPDCGFVFPPPDRQPHEAKASDAGNLATTMSITVRTVAGEPYERIIDYELGEMPEPLPTEARASSNASFDHIPF